MGNSPLEESITVAVDDGNRIGIRNRDVMRLDPNKFTILLVRIVDSKISSTSSGLVPTAYQFQSSLVRSLSIDLHEP